MLLASTKSFRACVEDMGPLGPVGSQLLVTTEALESCRFSKAGLS